MTEEQRQKQRDYQKKWRDANKEKIAAKKKRYRETHKASIQESHRQWQRDNRDRVNAYCRKSYLKAHPLQVRTLSNTGEGYKFSLVTKPQV
jgi:hypothetical protein